MALELGELNSYLNHITDYSLIESGLRHSFVQLATSIVFILLAWLSVIRERTSHCDFQHPAVHHCAERNSYRMHSCKRLCFSFRNIGNHLVITKSVDACSGKPNFVSSLEHVQAQLTLSYNRRGNLAIYLISPQGTRSTLLASRSGVMNYSASLLGQMCKVSWHDVFLPPPWQTHCCVGCMLVVLLALNKD